MSTRKYSLAMKLTAVVGGFSVGLVGAEIIARQISPHNAADLLFNSSDASPMNLYSIDATTRVSTTPNLDTEISSLDYQVHIHTNSLGLRGPAIESMADKEQWIALGDSFTMSVQVEQDDSFSGLLGKELGVQVWNAGVDGYSTWQSKLRLEQISAQLPIRYAILTFFTGNDFQDNERFLAMQRSPLPGKPGDPIPRPAISNWNKWWLQHSYLYAHYRIWNKQQQLGSKNDFSKGNWQDELRIFTSTGNNRLNQLRKSTKNALQDLQAYTKKNNIQLLVAIAPPAFVVDQTRLQDTMRLVDLNPDTATVDIPQQTVLQIIQELGIRGCDLTEALRNGLENGQNPYLYFDGHWTKEGHQIVATRIKECLQ